MSMESSDSPEHRIVVAEEFAVRLGARYYTDGPKSGQEFRERLLEPHFANPKSDYIIHVDFTGTLGAPTSFLEEGFAGLYRRFPEQAAQIAARIRVTAPKDVHPRLEGRVNEYMRDEAAKLGY